jgi:hypothetical protein
MNENEKDKLILTLLAAWETSLHTVETLRMVAEEVPNWKDKFDRYQRDYNRTLHTTNRLAPVRNAIREIVADDGTELIIEKTQRLLNQKLN